MKTMLCSFLMIIGSLTVSAQINIPLFSEPASIKQHIGHTNFEISYERPKMNGRIIFGGLVPYNEVWRTGASKCTQLSFDTPIYISGKEIPAGTYSLFTIPTKDEWTIILNADTSLYGAYDYDKTKDVHRMKSEVMKNENHTEAFQISIDVVNDVANVKLAWDDISVVFKLETHAYANLEEQARDVLLNNSKLEEGALVIVAEYMMHNKSGFDSDYLDLAEQLVDKAIRAEKESSYKYRVKRDILKIRNQKEEYLTVSQQHISYLITEKPYTGYEEDIERIKREMEDWE